jgi:hypothetical protein
VDEVGFTAQAPALLEEIPTVEVVTAHFEGERSVGADRFARLHIYGDRLRARAVTEDEVDLSAAKFYIGAPVINVPLQCDVVAGPIHPEVLGMLADGHDH